MKFMVIKRFRAFFSILLIFISFLFSTCSLEDFDFDKLSDKVVYKPGLAFPIAKADVTLMDFLDENDSMNNLELFSFLFCVLFLLVL